MLGWLLWGWFGWLCRGGLFSGDEVGARAMKGFQAVERIGGQGMAAFMSGAGVASLCHVVW